MTEQFIGEIRIFAMPVPPPSWLPCDGAIYPIGEHELLYALIRNTYGGDGTTNFAVPDLRGRFAAGTNDAEGSLGSVLPAVSANVPQAAVNADNSQPYLALCVAIAASGLYPTS